MKNDRSDRFNLKQYDTYRKIRKPMPRPERVIAPKDKYERSNDWKREIEEDMDDDDIGGINSGYKEGSDE